jgi:membrane associated rhomboid family serine protease
MNKIRVWFAELLPFTFVTVMWLTHLYLGFAQEDGLSLAMHPRCVSGLWGIIFSPFLHGDFVHLLNNTIPLLVLGFLLTSMYGPVSRRVFIGVYIIHGILLWFFARDSYHIGSSGVVYGLAAFLFLSGIIRRHPRLMVITLLVVFLYGTMVWGVMPFDPKISWEAHLYGALTGLMLAVVFRKEGPQRPHEIIEDEDDSDAPLTDEELQLLTPEQQQELLAKKGSTPETVQQPVIRVLYDYTEKKPDTDDRS